MSIYRQHENPWQLEDQVAEVKKELAENPYDIGLAQEVAELEERVNFAWQDNEAEMEGYE